MKVFIIAALSADGFIAKNSHHFADWTSTEDKKQFVQLTKKAGAMVMGRNTYDTIGKTLPGRKTYVYTSKPIKDDDVVPTKLSPGKLVNEVQLAGFDQLAVCGGQAVYDMFLRKNLVDEIYLTIEPKLFGAGLSLSKTINEKRLRLLEPKKLNDDTLFLHYKVIKDDN